MTSGVPAQADLTWWRPVAIPVDQDGPTTVPFEPLGWDALDRPVFEHVTAIADRQPAAAALRDGARALSYGALCRRVRGLAGRIIEATPRDAAVAVLLPDGLDAAVAMLACFAAARVCLMISTDLPQQRIATIIEGGGAAAVVLQAGAVALPRGVRPIIVDAPDDDAIQIGAGPVGATSPRLDVPHPDEPAITLYTSGSTGQPKGIVRSHRQVAYLGWKKVNRFHLHPGDRVLAPYTLTTGGGIVGLMMTLMAGACFYPVNVPRSGARAVLALARRERITLLTGTPSLLRVLFGLDGAAAAFDQLRALYTTGETLLRADIDAWRRVLPERCDVAYVYGMSEAAPLAEWFLPRELPEVRARLPIGYLNADHEYAISNDRGQPVAPGEAGELWVRGRLLSLGEWDAGRRVPGRLLADPADPASAVLRTGDVVRLRPDGLLEFVGRTDTQVKIRGNRVEPAEIEDVLRRANDVADVAVVAHRASEETVLVAFVACTTAAGEDSLRDRLTQRLHAALPSYMHPSRIVFIDRPPRTRNGKLDVEALLAHDKVRPLSRLRRWLGPGGA
jgi:amino acid adenylation domain-containing protein